MSVEVALPSWLVRLVINLGSGIILGFDERLFINIFKDSVCDY